MKKLISTLSAIALALTTVAQTPVEQGNIIIDPYIGIPNWANSLLYNQFTGDNADNVSNYKTNGSMLSYGLRAEYMVADNFGIGIDGNYEVSGYNYDGTKTVEEYNNTTMQYETKTYNYNYDYAAKKLRVMARLNYHFVQNDRVDAYAGFAGGYKNVNRAFTTNDPDYVSDELSGALVPFTLRLAIGTRVYFTDNIGAHMELGAFGGGLLQFGISAKF